MLIKKLTAHKIDEFSKLVENIISNTPYYTLYAKEQEIKKFSKQSLKKKIKESENIYLYAEDDKNNMIAFLNGYYDCATFWCSWLGVIPEYRGSGLAKNIMEFLEKEVRLCVNKIWFDTLVDNKEAIKLAEKLGYVKNTRFNNHWYNQDFYIWEKELNKLNLSYDELFNLLKEAYRNGYASYEMIDAGLEPYDADGYARWVLLGMK